MAGNLRDRGYPQSRSTQNSSNKRKMPMNKDIPVEILNRETSRDTNIKDNDSVTDKLVKAYTSRMFGTRAPRIQKLEFDTGTMNDPNYASERGYIVRDWQNNRLGTMSKNVGRGNGKEFTEYQVMTDIGNPDRGTLSIDATTPFGNVSGGYDAETDYFTYRSPDDSPIGVDAYMSNNGKPIEMSAGVGTSDVTGGDMFYADAKYPFTKDRYHSLDTPVGNFSLFTTAKSPFNEGYGTVDFTPANYIQALINLLKR